ncbi:MAG: hypothetical protein LBG87_01780 [Spirochaetaceae bacterium]|jgi:hypothetical protein|nr:hypothetical protein [Spirochaetaceae bacterium]
MNAIKAGIAAGFAALRVLGLRVLALNILALSILACSENGGDLLFIPDAPDKYPPKSSRIVRVAQYIDTAAPYAAETLVSVPGYVLEGSQKYYFDYAILSGASVKQGDVTAYLTYSDELLFFLRNRETYLKPLRDRGIKVLLGITGGFDSVSFGSLRKTDKDHDDSVKKMFASEQALFAQECSDACKFYGLDGVEFYDINAAGEKHGTPYPEIGQVYWDGEKEVRIEYTSAGVTLCNDAWKDGGGKFADMLSYLIEALGASASFQGDLDPDAKWNTPILVREAGFGRYLPSAVPRYAFATTGSCVTYGINADPNTFGYEKPDEDDEEDDEDDERIIDGESSLDFIQTWDYAPANINIADIDDERLALYSARLGRDKYGTMFYAPAEHDYKSPYGLVYYTNVQPPSSTQTEKFSVTSREVFGKAVVFR